MNEQLNTIVTSPAVRKAIYAGLSVAGVAYGATQVAFAAASLGQPVWLTVAGAVLAFLGAPVGSLALANTPKATGPADVTTPAA